MALIKLQVANHTLITPQTLLREQYNNLCQISWVGETIRKNSVVKESQRERGKKLSYIF